MTVESSPGERAWEEFVARRPHAPLLQSWAWGEFQTAVGRPAKRFLLYPDRSQPTTHHPPPTTASAAVQALKHRYPLGFESFYVPHGPVFAHPGAAQDPGVWQSVRDAIDAAAGPKTVFVRTEPAEPIADSRLLVAARQRPSVQPRLTHVLDLAPDEGALLAAMRPKTRYNIRLAERHGVRVLEGGSELFEHLTALLTETAQREGVHFFSPSYFRALLHTPGLDARLYCGRVRGAVVTAILVVRYGDTTTYLHGGSSRRHRETMAPFLVQWSAIRAAKAAGARFYDFHGVAPADALPNHPWAGFSRFKRGFGGVDVERGGAYDWVRMPVWYWLYRLGQRAGLRS
ncbi:MAG: peptidoglycan bridge formation glycyltransferase FemA/FemB family protein [Candidatus Kerfeldbacteria bacterium]|nr:peptidoglycan bridge formation glycyltransferase FemA/FemB family protein [Candidatus Kerfeldbacteria bacterium]